MATNDRRAARHRDSIDEIVGHAVSIMETDGVAGLSLGEVARRMGVRTPSLYVYVDSKGALYDEIFRRGWVDLGATMRRSATRLGTIDAGTDLRARFRSLAATFVRWCLTHRAHAQLMVWRPVPRWEPSPAAFEPAVLQMEMAHEELRAVAAVGRLAPDSEPEEIALLWTTVVSGAISQQLANEPLATHRTGRYVAVLPSLVDLVVDRYMTPPQEQS
ncbi:MAG: TetR/AcrR family transcriptional regulator [Knoellia sp.]